VNTYVIEYDFKGRRYTTAVEAWTAEGARTTFKRDNPGCELVACDYVPQRPALTAAQHNAFPGGRW
jgi:hypothetical protein